MYRWPIRLLEGREGGGREPTALVLEVPPRGAAFTLASLSHLGHPIHLALIDAFLAGGVPMPRGLSLGEDSRAVVAALSAPLALMYQLGGEETARATLADVLLLPPAQESPGRARFLFLASAERHLWLTSRSEDATDAESGWHRIATTLPASPGPHALDGGAGDQRPLHLLVQSFDDPRPTTARGGAPVRAALTRLSWGRIGADPRVVEQAVDSLRRTAGGATLRVADDPFLYGLLEDAVAEAAVYRGMSVRTVEPDRLDSALRSRLVENQVVASTFTRGGRTINAAGTVDRTGGVSLALTPRKLTSRDRVVASMADATWDMLERLIGRPLAERRTEAITLRLVGPERAAELLIGWSLVLPRNRRVFAAWLGSDGRVLIRLFGGDDTPTAAAA